MCLRPILSPAGPRLPLSVLVDVLYVEKPELTSFGPKRWCTYRRGRLGAQVTASVSVATFKAAASVSGCIRAATCKLRLVCVVNVPLTAHLKRWRGMRMLGIDIQMSDVGRHSMHGGRYELVAHRHSATENAES